VRTSFSVSTVSTLSAISVFFFLILAAIPTAPLFARSKQATFGGPTGWKDLSRSAGIARGTGTFGYESLELASNVAPVTEYTDLLLDFEDPRPIDATGNYTAGKTAVLQDKGIINHHAALSLGEGGIEMYAASPGAIFGGPNVVGSFSLSFWLKPRIAESGEQVLFWRSFRVVDNAPVQQTISVSYLKNRLVWSFTNVFEGYTRNKGEIVLTCERQAIPDTWMHYAVSFDETTGALEYRINGRLEAITFTTATGKEGGSISVPVVGKAAPLQLCPKYTGSMDEFRLSRQVRAVPFSDDYTAGTGYYTHNNIFPITGGRIETPVIHASKGAVFQSLDAMFQLPDQTGVDFFVRGGDDVYTWSDSEPAWVPVTTQKAARNAIQGEYFQIAAMLYPDGAGAKTPSLTQMTITWNEEPPPLPPFTVEAIAKDGAVVLEWLPSVDANASGYCIYYGERPGEYMGANVPLMVGNTTRYTLDMLQNGKVYYFAVAAVSQTGSASPDSTIIGDLSREVWARPHAAR
jgi:hypothetical protein